MKHMTLAPTLVNLTGKPVFAIHDGTLIQLDAAPPPRLLEMTSRQPPQECAVTVAGVEITIDEVTTTGGLFSGPPVIDGVLWLVTSRAHAQFPHRSDFVRPATYRLEELDGIDCSGVDDDVLSEAEMLPGHLMVLHSITRTPSIVAADAERLEDLEAREPDEACEEDHADTGE